MLGDSLRCDLKQLGNVSLTQPHIAVPRLQADDGDAVLGLILDQVIGHQFSPPAVVRKSRITVSDGKTYEVSEYNLDVIISVGYRVKSQRGTQFRIWANNVLKQYLVQGYALNERKLQTEKEKLNDLKHVIALSSRLLHNQALSPQESQSILTVLEKYSHALTVLDDYDHQRLMVVGTKAMVQPKIDYHEAMAQIYLWREKEKLGGLFGFYNEMSTYTMNRVKSALQIMLWWLSPCLLLRVNLTSVK